MGEYAMHNGQEIKIGTCDDMYYLRADQRNLVTAVSGSLDPRREDVQKVIRFRFPFPDEDHIQPGGFEDFNRGITLSGVKINENVTHGTVQFRAEPGYLVSIPCPEGPEADHGLRIGRNGFAGNVSIKQQAFRNGHLALIAECRGCGHAFNLPTAKDAAPYVEAVLRIAERYLRTSEYIRANGYADEQNGDLLQSKFYTEVARRIMAGYRETLEPATV